MLKLNQEQIENFLRDIPLTDKGFPQWFEPFVMPVLWQMAKDLRKSKEALHEVGLLSCEAEIRKLARDCLREIEPSWN